MFAIRIIITTVINEADIIGAVEEKTCVLSGKKRSTIALVITASRE